MKPSRIVLPALVVFAAAAAALAGDPHGAAHGHEPATAIPSVNQGVATGITALVIFIITAIFLGAVVWPKISKALEARENKIRSEIEAAELAQEQAKAALKQYEKNLAEARAEAQRMLEQTKAEQQALAADLKAKADAELAQMRERARRDIEAAKRAAIGEIYEQAVQVATIAAGKILQREVSPADQRRLVEESLNQLQAGVR